MKQLLITGYGEVEKNLTFSDVDLRKIKSNEVLIEIHYAGINPIDYKIIEGAMKPINKLKFPAPIGFDFSGIIVQKGKDVTKFNVNDKVYGRVPDKLAGTFAEKMIINYELINKAPNNISLEKASCMPLVSLTVFQAFEKINLQKEQKILIHAGSGGIGSIAIQYAKHLGAYVYTTTSTKNIEWVKKLGADRVIDYKTEDYKEIISNIDAVFDTLGKNYTIDAFKIINKGAKVVSLSGDLDNETAKELGLNKLIRLFLSLKRLKLEREKKRKNATYKYVYMKPNTIQLDCITDLIEKDVLKPVIDKVFDFKDSIEALTYIQKGRAKGKVILKMIDPKGSGC
jgi:NADPH:quinone reductase-like Zn-dependent oxidoreductase